jgi:hypothetical protein
MGKKLYPKLIYAQSTFAVQRRLGSMLYHRGKGYWQQGFDSEPALVPVSVLVSEM